MTQEIKEKLMRLAIAEAEKAVEAGDSPFGAVLADLEGNVVATSHNTTSTDCDPTAHAEINLIKQVSREIASKDLSDYCLISNAQSCPMCFSAAIGARIENFIFGADSEGHMNPNLSVLELAKYSSDDLNIETGVLKEECEKQIKKGREKLDN